MTEALRLMIAADHLLFGESLARKLAMREKLDVIAVTTVERAVEPAISHRPSAVLIELGVEIDCSLALAKLLRFELPSTKVILLGLASVEQVIMKCIEVGADAYLSKDASLNELVTAIHSSFRGDIYCSPRILYFVFSKLCELASTGESDLPRHFSLSPREVEVLRLIGDGSSNKRIGEQLNLSRNTIKNHVHNILEKLQLSNRSDIARYGIQRGLI